MTRASFRFPRAAVVIPALLTTLLVICAAQAWQDLPKIVRGTAADVGNWKPPTAATGALPLGAIVSFYGDWRELEATGWVPCNGEACPDWADERVKAFLRAHGSEVPGCVPNLNDGRFTRGVPGLDELGRTGGTDRIPADGEHVHSSGGVTLKRGGEDSTPQYAHQAAGMHDHGGENRPPFLNVTFIMRVK
jgi:hypothetical protein